MGKFLPNYERKLFKLFPATHTSTGHNIFKTAKQVFDQTLNKYCLLGLITINMVIFCKDNVILKKIYLQDKIYELGLGKTERKSAEV